MLKDEILKDQVARFLVGMQRRGVIDEWQDRLIEPGDAWYPAINAINEFNLVLLLVSANFLASRFINDTEVLKSLRRRQDERRRIIIPIILRPCMWNSEPMLKDLQALPRNGKPIITFAEETGERDQVWTDIAKDISRAVESLKK